jgi:hypothetical protein
MVWCGYGAYSELSHLWPAEASCEPPPPDCSPPPGDPYEKWKCELLEDTSDYTQCISLATAANAQTARRGLRGGDVERMEVGGVGRK